MAVGLVVGCWPDVVGAPFPLAGRAGEWVGCWWRGFILGSLQLQAGSLNASPLVNTAQAMRAFFAAMATTAFQ